MAWVPRSGGQAISGGWGLARRARRLLREIAAGRGRRRPRTPLALKPKSEKIQPDLQFNRRDSDFWEKGRALRRAKKTGRKRKNAQGNPDRTGAGLPKRKKTYLSEKGTREGEKFKGLVRGGKNSGGAGGGGAVLGQNTSLPQGRRDCCAGKRRGIKKGFLRWSRGGKTRKPCPDWQKRKSVSSQREFWIPRILGREKKNGKKGAPSDAEKGEKKYASRKKKAITPSQGKNFRLS